MNRCITLDNIYFTGYASVFGVVDIQNDCIMPYAFYNNLLTCQQVRLLFEHDPSQIIGTAIAKEDKHGLYIEGNITMRGRKGIYVQDLIKRFKLNYMSIGYVTKNSYIKDNIRHVTDASLHEVSLVSKPANNYAKIQSVQYT